VPQSLGHLPAVLALDGTEQGLQVAFCLLAQFEAGQVSPGAVDERVESALPIRQCLGKEDIGCHACIIGTTKLQL
jgi:hypothetical protein